MKKIVNLALKTEYSFKETFGIIDEVAKFDNGNPYIGIADTNNSFGHVKFQAICKERGVKPIFGVRLMVVDRPEDKDRARFGPEYIFIAKNPDGLNEIYQLITTAYRKFFYKAMIGIDDMLKISDNVFVICECPQTLDRLDYIALSPKTPRMMAEFDIPKVAIVNNRYSRAEDKSIYQMLAGARKQGTGVNFLFNDQTYPQHILSTEEWFRLWKDEEAIENTHKIAIECDNFNIPKASMVKYDTDETVEEISRAGAKRKGIDLTKEPYKSRFEWELSLIVEKEYEHYFLIVSDMIRKAKKKMLVGPARGSAAGSLICFLMDITEVDPIRFNLLFERFIDINREDLPDIDIDFPDQKRKQVIDDLIAKFKDTNVCHISNVNTLRAKSAIGEIGMSLSIPKWEIDPIKDFLVDRSGGDARAKLRATDTINSTDFGKAFIKKYPAALAIEKVEGHASHAGMHAAGIIVCNEPITKFGGVNTREGSVMLDKKDAEKLNLLKIDCLGLRTLSVLEDCAEQIGMDYVDFYTLPLDDEKTFQIFKDMRLSGIFQFEGRAMNMLCKQMGGAHNFNDIVALTALARPGPLHSGGAGHFIRRRTGQDPVEYISNNEHYIACTEETLGVIIYQEQLMEICRVCGNMNYEEVAAIRRGSSKTLGKEFFQKYFESFKRGALENGFSEDELTEIWENMVTFGSWGMNKSHTVSYGYISYWCAYMKAHHPLEFTVANLRHAKSSDSALKLLRDAYEEEGFEYVPVDPDTSELDWSVQDGVLVGGLKNIHGIGEKKAQQILKIREKGKGYTPAIVRTLMAPVTDFDTLYPCQDRWNAIYTEPYKFGLEFSPSYIKEIEEPGIYVTIGKVVSKDLRDLNEYNEIMKRGGQVLEKDNKVLRLVIEDDTDKINCKISARRFDEMDGQKYSEELIENETWVIVRGQVREGWRIIDIYNIFDLKNFNLHGEMDSE